MEHINREKRDRDALKWGHITKHSGPVVLCTCTKDLLLVRRLCSKVQEDAAKDVRGRALDSVKLSAAVP